MSKKYPIIAVTGSSGAGTSSVRPAFERMFHRLGIATAMVQGDGFHRFERTAMRAEITAARAAGRYLSHFGPEGNQLELLEQLFSEYGTTGSGTTRRYIHNEEALQTGITPGTFTPWQPLPDNTSALFYEGLHGGLITDKFNIAQHVDLLIGEVPIINLEWIQKIHRDFHSRGYSLEESTESILHRMHDYVHYIVPQFSRTDINFQRVPMVDTSNPFIARDIPSTDETLVVIHERNPRKTLLNFTMLLQSIGGSFMSRRDTIVIPGGKKNMAIEIILEPIIERLIAQRSI